MPSNGIRWVRLDGTSSALEFDGPWIINDGLPFPYASLASEPGSMKFVFNGSELAVSGYTYEDKAVEGVAPPFSCTVDGVAVFIDYSENRYACLWKETNGTNPHTFLLNYPNMTRSGRRLAVDAVWYAPLPTNPPLGKGAWAAFTHEDPDIKYSGVWSSRSVNGEFGLAASQNASSLNLTFTGSQAVWEGLHEGFETQSDLQRNLSLGSLTVDEGSARPFNISLTNSTSELPMSKSHFLIDLTRGELSVGKHTATLVTDTNWTLLDPPVLFFQLLVERGNFLLVDPPDPTSTVSPEVKPTVAPPIRETPVNSTLTTDRSIPIGAIVGGTIGGFVTVALLLVAAMLWVRRRKRRQQTIRPTRDVEPFVLHPIRLPDTYHKVWNTSTAPHTGWQNADTISDIYQYSTSDNSAIATTSSGDRLTFHIDQKAQQLHSAIPGEKDQEPGLGSLPLRHQDSGVRLRALEGLPPIYTIE
ncbi:hypothetical protein BKA70DRAFT_1229045 [Coprinopsis sp. MPI-PUGE-AT-0042]|nr:hypothetical protein BKA70DRAFT_1229045 [Coprinopsis sp. MPI-PUGE-AT-0042]